MTTKIEWVARPGTTPETWNLVTGCTKVSPGCKHCYAERMAKRLAGRFGYPADEPFRVTLHPDRLEKPLRWRKPRTVFVCSMGDLFHEDVPFEFIRDVWGIMETAYKHTFLVLTKRPRRMREFLTSAAGRFAVRGHMAELPNVWLGVTAENQAMADERIPLLLQAPAAVRFVSVEPMLEAIQLDEYFGWCEPVPPFSRWENTLDWVIAGGESGPGARPMDPDWLRGLRDQCQAAGVPYFFKQHGAWLHESQFTSEEQVKTAWSSKRCKAGDGQQFVRVGKKAAGRLLDGREWNEWPGAR